MSFYNSPDAKFLCPLPDKGDSAAFFRAKKYAFLAHAMQKCKPDTKERPVVPAVWDGHELNRVAGQLASPVEGELPRAAMINNLATHPRPYVSVGELATYWGIGRKQIYKQLDAGTLEAIRLGPRLYRIRTAQALEFERKAKLKPAESAGSATRRSRASKIS